MLYGYDLAPDPCTELQPLVRRGRRGESGVELQRLVKRVAQESSVSTSSVNKTELSNPVNSRYIQTLTFVNGKMSGNRVSGEDTPYVYCRIGRTKHDGLLLKVIKDSGCTKSTITEQLWNCIPGREWVTKTYTNQVIVTAAGTHLNILFEVEMWLTFYTSDERQVSYFHGIQICDGGLEDDFYLGDCFLGSTKKVYETPNILMLQKDGRVHRTITVEPNNDLFPIPIHTNKKLNSGVITIDSLVILKPKHLTHIEASAALESPWAISDVTFRLESFCEGLHVISADYTRDSNKRNRGDTTKVRLTLSNAAEYPIRLDPGDQIGTLVPKRRASLQAITPAHRSDAYMVDANKVPLPDRVMSLMEPISHSEMGMMEEKLREDKFYTEDDIAQQLQYYQETGKCSLTASQALEDSPMLQILEEPEENEVNFTPEELIEGLPLKHLSHGQREQVKAIFREHIDCLARNSFDVTHTPLLKAKIVLKPDAKITNAKHIPIAWHLMKGAARLINYYIKKGIMVRTTKPSMFTSNIMFLPKKDTTQLRALLDARILNYNCKKLSMAMTSHQEILAMLSSKIWLTCMDVSNAFFSIEIDEETRHHTSFFDHKGRRVCFSSLPQGYLNSSYHLAMLMGEVLKDMPDCHSFADDIIITGNGTFEEHVATVKEVLRRLCLAKLRLKHTKISFCKPWTEFMGIMYSNKCLDIPAAKVQGYMDSAAAQDTAAAQRHNC